MGTWFQLSPAERQAAREQYKSLRALPPEKKQEVRQQWERYQSLPPERKQELADGGRLRVPRRWRRASGWGRPRPHASFPLHPRLVPPRSERSLTRQAHLAPLLRRYAALGYEGLLLAAVVLLAGFLTLPATRSETRPGGLAARAEMPAGRLALPPLPARVLSACVVFGAAGLYCVVFWSHGRRTLPMKTWRLALVRSDGRALDAKTAVLRYLCAWIGPGASLAAYAALQPANLGAHAAWLVPIGYLWPFVDPERLFLHDRLAGTRLVMAPADPSSGARAPRATLISAIPAMRERIERLVEQQKGHDGRHGGNEKEQAGDVRRGSVPKQPVEEADRAHRQHDDGPAQRKRKLGQSSARARARTRKRSGHTRARTR